MVFVRIPLFTLAWLKASVATHMHMQMRRFTNGRATHRMAAAGSSSQAEASSVRNPVGRIRHAMSVVKYASPRAQRRVCVAGLPAADGGYLFCLTQPSACGRDGHS